MKKILIAAMFCLVINGCVSATGNKNVSDKSIITKIKKGETTKSQIVEWFGQPSGKSFEGDYEVWDYSYNYSKTTPLIFVGAFLPSSNIGQTVIVSLLKVKFDNKSGVVIGYGHDYSKI